MKTTIDPLLLPTFRESFRFLDFGVTLDLHRGRVRTVVASALPISDASLAGPRIEVPVPVGADVAHVIEFACIEAALRFNQTRQGKDLHEHYIVEFDALGW